MNDKTENKDQNIQQSSNQNDPQEAGNDIEALKGRVTELEKTIESLKDQMLRKAADFENYKRRIENDMATIGRFANEGLILEILPILDDFTRSMKSGKERREFGPFYQGIELIYSKLMKVLESQGVKPMECVGKQFNVDYHDALMQMPKEGAEPHTVIEEVERGYMLHDKVLRHAKVVVAGLPQDAQPAGKSDEAEQ